MTASSVKTVLALSGGVDSSAAACLLKDQGHEVIGVSLHLYDCHRLTNTCCTAADRLLAKQVCQQLKIPHLTLDYRQLFDQRVIQPFVKEYLSAKTPNPCVWCNQHIKFLALNEARIKFKADLMATGH